IIHRLLRKLGCTSIVISETPWGVDSLGSGVEEFVVDGIIKLELLPVKGELKRRLAVVKMRGVGHEMKFYQYSIVPKDGIVITPYPEVF
ncbi:MAG: ATPase domain-containing protein, partial [Candidatus Bathyarchaeia archaeon]